jgi:Fe-S-cluster containining protein
VTHTAASESNPCTSCGACCATSHNWPRFSLESEDEIGAIPAAFVNERGMRCVGDRCSALDGDVGVATRCRVYEVRPLVCRDCEPGDTECAKARRRFGLAPLAGG